MADTPRAGTGDFVCRSWRYWCSTMLNRLGNLSTISTLLISSLPPLIFFLPFFCLLPAVTDACIWIPYLARYLETFKEPNFQVVKCKPTFIWKMLSKARLETEGSGLATIFGLPHPPLMNRVKYLRAPPKCLFKTGTPPIQIISEWQIFVSWKSTTQRLRNKHRTA